MRVALLQTELDPRGRAANIQAIIAAIHRAAGASPAPDLLVLPGACDTGGVAPGRGFSANTAQIVRETIAMKAREWGVYIAAGLHTPCDERWLPTVSLFDPDADTIAEITPTAQDADEPAAPMPVWACAVGRIGVWSPQVTPMPPFGELDDIRGVLMVVPLAPAALGKKQHIAEGSVARLRNDPQARGGAYWVCVVPAHAERKASRRTGVASFVCGPAGEPIAAAEDANETIIVVDIPQGAPVGAGRRNRDGQAD